LKMMPHAWECQYLIPVFDVTVLQMQLLAVKSSI
jgi:hypothetical protein